MTSPGVGVWRWLLGPATGGYATELTAATQRRLTVRLTSPSETSFTIDGRHPQAAAVTELATDLHVLYTPAAGPPTTVVYRGRIGGSTDAIDQTRHTVTVSSMDYRELLKRRLLYNASTLTWTGVDQAEIAWQLLQQTQTLPGGNLGISKGTGNPSGVTRTVGYAAGDSIGARIDELSQLTNGFEWDIRPAGESALALDIYTVMRGAYRGVVLEHGGLVQAVQREARPADYANSIRVTGDQTATTPPTPQERTAADIATRPEGRWDKVITAPGVTDLASLQARADWQLADAQVVQPAYTLTLKRGGWQGPSHIWLGDIVLLVVDSGRLAVAGTPVRVQEMTFDLPDTAGGDETVSIVVGRPRINYDRIAPEFDRRLRDLERR